MIMLLVNIPMYVQFSNPRLVSETNDWPSGGMRVYCRFSVEYNSKKGYRVSRVTANKHGVLCKPKFTTYSGRCVIVDGDDGRTYILRDIPDYGFISIEDSAFMSPQESSAFPGKDGRYEELKEIIDSVSFESLAS